MASRATGERLDAGCRGSYTRLVGFKEDLNEFPEPLRPVLAVVFAFGYARGVFFRFAVLAVAMALVVFGDTLARIIGACGLVVWFGIAGIWYFRRRRPAPS